MASARQSTSNTFDLWVSVWALPELVEGAARAGDTELHGDALDRLVETTQPCGTDDARGIEARCRALLSDGAAAEELYRESIDSLSRTQLRPELARAHLLYGSGCGARAVVWMRASSCGPPMTCASRSAWRRSGTAHGANSWPPASGCASAAPTRDELTPQEEQIARLARDGLSNPEIGAHFFISARTVEWHLGKVFTKLRISSRRGLRAALPGAVGSSRAPSADAALIRPRWCQAPAASRSCAPQTPHSSFAFSSARRSGSDRGTPPGDRPGTSTGATR